MTRQTKWAVGVGVAVVVLVVIGSTMLRNEPSGPADVSFERTFDFGDVVQGEELEHVFSVANDSEENLFVDRVVVSYASAVVSSDSVLPAGGVGRFHLKVDTRSLRGRLKESARIYFTEEGRDPVWLHLEGRVVLPVEIAPNDRIYFFTIKGQAPRQEILVINHQERPLEVTGVSSNNPLVRVELEELERRTRFRLIVALDPAAPVGRHEADLTVATDSPAFPSLAIEALAIVEELVSASLDRIDFPRVLYDSLDREVISRKVVLVEKHDATDFEVVRATTELPFLSVEVVPDRPGASYLVYVRIVQSLAERGEFEGTLTIETNDPETPEIRLPVSGTIV